MFTDSKTPLSPLKGKAKEEIQWRSGWWDFYPLVEQPHRPVEWSDSSVIFTAHPTQPLVTARHFSSSREFVIPSPAPIVSSPASYEPPSVISVAPGDSWLFAYFPRRDNDGTGCLWKRGPHIDSWIVKEWWSFARGAGAVAASWLGSPREWTTGSTGLAARLPPRGPITPVSHPTLLLVTQDHRVNVCYIRYYIPSLKMISCSVTQSDVSSESHPSPLEDTPSSTGSTRVCTTAAIGLGYNDTSVLIATRSHLLPLSPAGTSQFDSMDLSIPVNLTQQHSSGPETNDWEAWGEESIIELCEVQLKFDGVQMSITTNSLPPIQQPVTGLTNLSFVCTPPPSPPSADLMKSPLHNRAESGKFYLTASHLDLGNYTSTPKSELVLYSIFRHASTWTSHCEAERTFTPGVLAFLAPCATTSTSYGSMIYAGILDTSGSGPRRSSRVKEVAIGTVKLLNVPNLTDNNAWEGSKIVSSASRLGRDLPLNAAVSPNGVLLCTAPSTSWRPQTSIHRLSMPEKDVLRSSNTMPTLSSSLSSAISSRRTTADIAHILSLPATSFAEVIETFRHTLALLDAQQNGLSRVMTWELLGVAVEVYRARARHAEEEAEKETFAARWQAIHDMFSLGACSMAFEECKEGDLYDLEAVWQLIGLSTWVVNFVERLMRECVLSADLSIKEERPSDDLFGSAPPSPDHASAPPTPSSPILLHLVHPNALRNLTAVLGHVRRFRAYIGSLPAGGESSHVAKDVLIDLVDHSGIDFAALDQVLIECIRESSTLAADDCRRCLAAFQPTPAMYPHLRKVIHRLTQSTVLDKFTLFVKPADLVDGFSHLSIHGQRKDRDQDVISKGLLTKRGRPQVCLRCGGKSELGPDMNIGGHVSFRWRAWEKKWVLRCICGGLWTRDPT